MARPCSQSPPLFHPERIVVTRLVMAYSRVPLLGKICIHQLAKKSHKSPFVFFLSLFRLKEEQRWVGMPEWKKHLLSRRGTGQIYRDYHSIHSGNFLRRTRSAEPHNTTQSTEFDYVTRPRGISSLN